MTILYVLFLMFFALCSFATPICYTFLRLMGKIGPQEDANAFILGAMFWILGLVGGAVFIGLIEQTVLTVSRSVS